MAARPTKRQRSLISYSVGTDKAQVECKTSLRHPFESNRSSENGQDHAPWPSNLSSALQNSSSSTLSAVDKEGTQSLSTTNTSHRRHGDVPVVDAKAERPSGMHESTNTIVGLSVDEDIVDDYDSCEELFTKHFSGEHSANRKATPKPSRRNGASNAKSSQSRSCLDKIGAPSKRFIMPFELDDRVDIPPSDSLGDDSTPWAQRFQPLELEELAVHKKKVSDVRGWLEASFSGIDKSVCISHCLFSCSYSAFSWCFSH